MNFHGLSNVRYTFSHHYTLDMIEFVFVSNKSLSDVFGRTKLHKKGPRHIIFFLLKKAIALLRSIFNTTLVVVQSNILHKKCL